MNIEVIAEAAQGYLGDAPGKTRLLVACAAAAGADGVKFQLVYADEICTPDHQHYDLFRRLEMPDSDWMAVADHARERGIGLYFDIFGSRSLDLASRVGAAGVKLHSTDVLNIGLIRQVAAGAVARVLLSAGGAYEPELFEAVALLTSKEVVLMHGFQGYPTRTEDNQIARLAEFSRRYPGCTLGFADHVPEADPVRFWLSAAAIGAGARVIEKHVTTALVLREEDHESALNPDEFARFVSNVRQAAAAVGATTAADDFGMSEGERRYRSAMKKQVVAARRLEAGTVLESEDLTLKRTSATESIYRDVRDVLGRRLRARVELDQPIRGGDLA